MKKNKVVLMLLASILVILPLATAVACAQPKLVEEPKGEIVIGALDDLSGPMAGTDSGILQGYSDCIKYINEKGGIMGHPIRDIVVDFKMDSTLALSGWSRLKGEKVPLITSTAAVVLGTIAQSADKDHIVVVTGLGLMDQLFPKQPSYYFCTGPQVMGTFTQLFELIEKDWAMKGQNRTPRIGVDVVTLGNQAKMYEKEIKIELAPRKWEYLITRTSIAAADATTQVLQMKQFNPDYVFLNNTESTTNVWLKELDRQNFHPAIYASTNAGSPEIWRASGSLAVGVTLYQLCYQWTDTDVPFVSWLDEVSAKMNPGVTTLPAHYIRGFSGMLVMAEALKRAINKVGFENLNGDALKEAMETINGFDPAESISGVPKVGIAYTFTPTDHQGTRGALWYIRTKEGTLKRVADYKEFPPLKDEQKSDSWWLQD